MFDRKNWKLNGKQFMQKVKVAQKKDKEEYKLDKKYPTRTMRSSCSCQGRNVLLGKKRIRDDI
jgi:hypothetical protein